MTKERIVSSKLKKNSSPVEGDGALRGATCGILLQSLDMQIVAERLSRALEEQGVSTQFYFISEPNIVSVTLVHLSRASDDLMVFLLTDVTATKDSILHIAEELHASDPNRIFVMLLREPSSRRASTFQGIEFVDVIVEGRSILDVPEGELVEAIIPRISENHRNRRRKFSESVLDQLNEGKLILIGRGEVGKTSLVRCLMGDHLRGDESKTQGINISSWLMTTRSSKLQLRVWDFGGQEIMHSTHQFFLTERSVYLIVLNGRECGEDTDVEYWLKHIESFGGASPVIVVQNKIDQHPFEMNYSGLRGRYPQIRAFVKTDCKSERGIQELRKAIEQAIEEIPEVRLSFPGSWLQVRNQMEKLPEPYLSYERFSDICSENGVTEPSDRDALGSLLHCLGITLNYRSDSRLRETSVLKPEWVTKGIYRILNAETLAARRGELALSDLKTLLPQHEYPAEKHLFLIELMRKFSLCFAFPDVQDRYLVPELLGKEDPTQAREFPASECLNFEYHYGVLPEGLVPRFIVRSHILSTDQPRWRTGVILAYEGCSALVIANPIDRYVSIRVKGQDGGARRRLLAVIRYDFERMHSEFRDRLEVRARIPLNQSPDVKIDYKKLVACERQGIRKLPELIEDKIVHVDVPALLNGVDFDPADSLHGFMREPLLVFFSYSHKDEALRDQLETHLKILERQEIISGWHDRRIAPGQEWGDEISHYVERAQIILLLISADFIASDYCWNIEVKRAMERHEKGDAVVVPILLRHCHYKETPFGALQGAPKDFLPVTSWQDRDAAWADVAGKVRMVAEQRKRVLIERSVRF